MPDLRRSEIILPVDEAVILLMRRTLPNGFSAVRAKLPGAVSFHTATQIHTVPINDAIRVFATANGDADKILNGIASTKRSNASNLSDTYRAALHEISTAIRRGGISREMLAGLDILRGALMWQTTPAPEQLVA